MTILAADIKLLESAVMADVPEGGGAASGRVIADGVSNAIFPDVSELDRAGGRVALRKVYAQVASAGTDTYFGANVIVAEPPQDPRVAITLFKETAPFDTRAQAQSRIEAYLNKGAEWAGYLFENHIAGQRVVQLFQRPGAALPTVGQTLVLVQDEGKSTAQEQYVRATAVSAVDRTYTYNFGNGVTDYAATIVTLSLSDALRTDFTGSPANRLFTRDPNATRVRDTVVADAGTYVGVVPLTAAAHVGDLTLKSAGVYTQLVPSAQTEVPISLAPPYAAAALPVPGAAPLTYSSTLAWNASAALQLPGGCLPGSLSVTVAGLVITDDGGILKTAGGQVGTIDYANGVLTVSSALDGAKAITYTPAAQLQRAPQSTEIPVTPESRGQSYVGVLHPTPQPGTLALSYMAQGRWYVLQAQGNGTLKGLDASFGAGTVDGATGAFVATLGALPDVGSSLILTWGVPTQETAQPVVTLKAQQTIALAPPADKTVQPGSLTITWLDADGTTTRSASAAASGALSGDASGTLRVAQASLDFAPNVMPPVGALLTIGYTAGPKQEDNFAHPSRDGGGKLNVTASLGAIVAGSLEVEWNTLTDLASFGVYTLEQLAAMGVRLHVDPTQIARDDGAGHLVLDGATVGSVNYATGAVQWAPDRTIAVPKPDYVASGAPMSLIGSPLYRLNYQGLVYQSVPTLYPPDETGYVKLRYNAAGSASNQSEQVEFKPAFALVTGVNAALVPGSVVLSGLGAQPWGDSGAGELRSFASGAWTTRGSISYLTGQVQLTSWTAGVANALTRASAVTTAGENISSEYVFRTAAAPLRPGSLTIQFARATGGVQTLTAATDGTLSASGVAGTVDYDAGLVRLRFGALVSAAGSEAEPWYDADGVDVNGKIWKPAPVAASTVKYTAVAFSYLPLDADLLGIDPVRLPSDGRVPIFRAGGFAVVGHSARITASVSNGQTIDCARVRLSRVRVAGADGVVITSGYTADLEAGKVTFSDVTGYSQPVTIEHRIEDMAVVRDVQISGEISFTRALTHEFPVATPGDARSGAYVASALVAGDLFARVSATFDQQTWSNVWQDSVLGNEAVATFNAALYPIAVSNQGAVTERWAIQFTGSTAFQVIGEHVGIIATGSTATDCAPVNPASGAPYFTLPALGWGAGWVAGNVLRFNTVAAALPLWCVRTVQQGPETVPDDDFTLLIRGDVDRP